MKLKTSIAITLGRLANTILSKRGGGSSFPGKLAEKIDKDILKNLSSTYDVIMVTGTNGKTLTTTLISNIIRLRDGSVLTNPTGANLRQGVITSFITSPDRKQAKVAVLEIDEATLKYITPHIKPKFIVFTNVFRDQMDRYGEIYTTYGEMVKGASFAQEAMIIANGDLPIFNSGDLANPIQFYGFNHIEDGEFSVNPNTDGILCPKCEHILRYKKITYANQGKYYCPNCEFRRPDLTYELNRINRLTIQDANFTIGDTEFHLPVAGVYNLYNALAAYSVAKAMDIDDALIKQGFEEVNKVFGRQEVVKIGKKDLILNIMKNPVGVNQLIDLISLEKDPFSLFILLNDRPADGTDVSWIWDGKFEELLSQADRPVLISGLRADDLKQRIEVCGLTDEEILVEKNLNEITRCLQNLPNKKVYVLATYTAMLDLRKVFKEEGFLVEDN